MDRPALAFVWFAAGCVVPYYQGPDGVDTDADVAPAETDTPETDAPEDDTESDEPGLIPYDGTPVDLCPEALDLEPAEAGYVSGSLAGFTASGLAPQCAAFSSVPRGVDGFFKLEIPARTRVDISFGAGSADGVVYVLSTCRATACVNGSDRFAAGAVEDLSVSNTTDEAQLRVLGIGVYNRNEPVSDFDLTLGFVPL